MKAIKAIILLATVVAVGFVGCSKSDSHSKDGHAHQYTCAHHPEVVQDKPGTCPKCGMKLTEKH